MKNLKEVILDIYQNIIHLKDNNDSISLPENTYILKDDKVLCLDRKFGESRFPYSYDGFNMWANSNGYISANESKFYVILPSCEGNEPFLAFYAGIKDGDKYQPYSIFNIGKTYEEKNVNRYTVYSKNAVYYLLDTENIIFANRLFVNEKKEINISFIAINKDNIEQDIYLSSYFNLLFKYQTSECFETKWFKKVTFDKEKESFVFESPEDVDRTLHIDNFGNVLRSCDSFLRVYNTTSKSEYTGAKSNQLNCSPCLREGKFPFEKSVTHFTDNSIAGDLIKIKLKDSYRVDYLISFAHDIDKLEKIIPNQDELDKYVYDKEEYFINRKNDLKMINFNFDSWYDNKINPKTLNKFLDYVIYQVEYCALAKNSGTIFLGVRDVIQQIESLLMWNPKASKEKIKEVLGIIDPSGNPPRQYSLPPVNSKVASMDLRPFIDQSVWIISTIYTYLSYTNDYDFLQEKCSYFKIISPSSSEKVDYEETVLEHMFKIMSYLESKIDNKYTHLLRAIYGDWNDALDGLGLSLDKDKDYGSGVSVMATLQYYQNLREMIDILNHLDKDNPLIQKYQNIRESIEANFFKYAICKKDNQRKIVHGWGDKVSYYVGSFLDVDKKSRDSSTSNSFFILSDMILHDVSMKNDILNAYHRLDSKYGIKTFEPGFSEGTKGVGRIIHLPLGTAENGATYVHGTLFAVDALFKIGEGKFATEQLEKVLPLTHEHLSTTPFVMSNSYVYNKAENMDGESMSDWYTGSATVLIKMLVHSLFGFIPDLDGVKIAPSNFIPSSNMSLRVNAKGVCFKINYINKHNNKRKFIIDEQEVVSKFDELRNTNYIYLKNEELKNKKLIELQIID